MDHTHGPNQQLDHFHHAEHDGILNGPIPLARGRQARDPQAKTITYNVTSLDEFEAFLREYLHNPPDEPEHTDCQLSFWIGTTFAVPVPAPSNPPQQSSQGQPPHFVQHADAPPGYQSANGIQQYGGPPNPYQSLSDPAVALTLSNFQTSPPPAAPNAHANASANGTDNNNNNNTGRKPDVPKVRMSVLEALRPTAPDAKERMRRQRAIAKCCVDAIQRTDGFRYSFHNCWNSREDDSFRFSYYCNDSLLNKDRAANGKGAKLGKRATKPVYDCKGVLSVKFSASKQSLDVFYKHNPVHKTYEERAPAPRKDSKRRKYLEENEPEVLSRIQSRPKPARAEPDGKPKSKKKKEPEEQKSSTSLESDLRAQSLRSLLELIRPDPAPEPALPEPAPPPPPPRQRQPSAPAPPPPPVHQQPQVQQQPRKRPRNSCDVCKAKKTKCDGTRPACNTCTGKGRQCVYTEAGTGDDRRPSIIPEPAESARQAQAASNELSALELMKRELEEAKARIRELEEEKRRTSTTPSQTPQMSRQPPPPPSQPQSQPHSDAKAHPPSHQQKRQRQQQPHQHQQGQQQQQVQIQNSTQPQAIHQLQNAAQQLQTPQQMPNSQQLHTPQFNHFNTHAPNPYGLNRPMSSQNMAQNMTPQNAGHATQSPTQQMHTASTGLTPTAEATNTYGRDFNWGAAYYGYQSAQQHQPDQWTAARNSGVFR